MSPHAAWEHSDMRLLARQTMEKGEDKQLWKNLKRKKQKQLNLPGRKYLKWSFYVSQVTRPGHTSERAKQVDSALIVFCCVADVGELTIVGPGESPRTSLLRSGSRPTESKSTMFFCFVFKGFYGEPCSIRSVMTPTVGVTKRSREK
jgi:hypothetical protein